MITIENLVTLHIAYHAGADERAGNSSIAHVSIQDIEDAKAAGVVFGDTFGQTLEMTKAQGVQVYDNVSSISEVQGRVLARLRELGPAEAHRRGYINKGHASRYINGVRKIGPAAALRLAEKMGV